MTELHHALEGEPLPLRASSMPWQDLSNDEAGINNSFFFTAAYCFYFFTSAEIQLSNHPDAKIN